MIPDRWNDYKAIGNVIEQTNFVAFKVPLHEKICKSLPKLQRHTTRDIIEAFPNIGLVINLTNTQTSSKYYQPDDWLSNGIDYKWIKVKGHVTPQQHLLVEFCRTVKKFMAKNPTKLIGIHCTHGLNRTGYFVCSYMVLVMNMDPDDAIRRFNIARGYEIERENYLVGIRRHCTDSRLKYRISQERNETEQSTRPSDRKRSYSSSSSSRDFIHNKRHKLNEPEDHHSSKPFYNATSSRRTVDRSVTHYPSNSSRHDPNNGYKTNRNLYTWSNKNLNQNRFRKESHQLSYSNKQYRDKSTSSKPNRYSYRSNDI
ncbi:hypothetical protein PVAND_010030 [Polypedilum vanderplanki]|uniref:Tyrosine specific protein phosphatases domain-containing protein n=1 Tax=Polypedilum vanderplanki TaxID=319348 RepID=A0A9J6CEL2_POLVA|nr:hypothetical protein PVAND_010030 [Polypedilum vanderplanki]